MACRWAAGVELAAQAQVVHLIGGGYVNRILGGFGTPVLQSLREAKAAVAAKIYS
ncbi:hypothetical protein G3I24_35555, partial [Micromonospora aurantiaca]|nr:hypothetical protein [Micromonospora aurantiaca]